MGSSPEAFGPYLIHEQLGLGGMATVHRAEQRGVEGFSKLVALKRLLPSVADDPTMVRSFIHEARLASNLHHANVAETYDLGKVHSTYFIAMEYIAGPTLTQVMRQCSNAAGAMPIPVVLSIIGQVCDALDHAHNLTDDRGRPLGIIHRDVSPSNVIVSNTGIVKLIDFGIAKAADSGVKTKTGLIKGKYAYIAPEYTRGHLDLRADLFGLGVIAHELLTNRQLFHARNDYDTIMRLREMPIQPPSRHNPQVTRDVDDIVMTALQRDPSARWQSAAAMRIAITNASKEVGVAGSQHVREWVEWAFARKPHTEDPALVRIIDMLEEPSSAAIELSYEEIEELERIGDPLRVVPSEPLPTAQRDAVEAVMAAETGPVRAPSKRRRRRSWWKVWLLLFALFLAASAVGYYLAVYELGYEPSYQLEL